MVTGEVSGLCISREILVPVGGMGVARRDVEARASLKHAPVDF